MGQRAHVISISGGKDSTATALLALERGVAPLRFVFADTGHEHPVTYAYIEYLQDKLGVDVQVVRADFKIQIANKREYIMRKWAEDGVPQERIDEALDILVPTGIPMLDLCLWKGRMPSTKTRFCTQELKVLPIINQVLIPCLREYGKVWSWQGVRADESHARALLRRMDREHDLPGVLNYRPILRWTADDVFAMHHKHGIEPNPLYKQGMGRVGCMPCINVRKGELAEISRRFPEELQRVARWEQLVSRAAKRGSTTWIPSVTHARGAENVNYEEHGIHAAAEWAKTSRGGRQYDWLIADDEVPVCSSVYGLCE